MLGRGADGIWEVDRWRDRSVWRWIHYSEVSEIKVGVGVWSWYLECQESRCVIGWRYISGFRLLELEGPYVIADERFKTTAGDED